MALSWRHTATHDTTGRRISLRHDWLLGVLRPGFAIVTAGVVLAGCAEHDTPAAIPVATTDSQSPPATPADFSNIPGEFPEPASLTDHGQSEAPVGGCANLSGSQADAVFTLVDCGSSKSTYRIIQRVATPQQCVPDADRSFYHNSTSTGEYTACLDLAWDPAWCVALGPPVAKVNCTDPDVPRKIKPTSVVVNTTGIEGCAGAANGGYSHRERRFTVCTQS